MQPFHRIFYTQLTRSSWDLINTPLQRGVSGGGRLGNRFNGFPQGVKTVETVFPPTPSKITPLKRVLMRVELLLRRFLSCTRSYFKLGINSRRPSMNSPTIALANRSFSKTPLSVR